MSSFTKPTPTELRDQLVEDAMKSSPPGTSARDVSDYMVGILRGMDRKGSFKAKPSPSTPKPKLTEQETLEVEFKKRTGREVPKGLIYTVQDTGAISIEGERKRITTEDDLKSGLMARIISRMRVIKHHPELFARVKILVICLNSRSKPKRLQAADMLYKMLDETDKIVGHSWRTGPSKKIIIA